MRVGPEVPGTLNDREVTPARDVATPADTDAQAAEATAITSVPPEPRAQMPPVEPCGHAVKPAEASGPATGPSSTSDQSPTGGDRRPTPPARSERVAKIRAAIATGNFPIDLDKLAEKIVEREVLAAGKRDPSDDNSS